jgi:glutaconate CoA-transferase, subunit A
MAQHISIAQAVELVPRGCLLALGGVTLYRRPVALALALAQHGAGDWTLLSFTAGVESDLLIGAGKVRAVRTCYFGLETFGLAPMFTQAAQAGTVQIIEESEASIALGLRAHLAGLPFAPSDAWQGTDLLTLRPDVRTIHDPYSATPLTAFPPLAPQVAIIHALEADAHGNVKINNNLGIDVELMHAAQITIASVERLVPQVARSTDGLILPAPLVQYVVHQPRGARPTSCHPLYRMAGAPLAAYVEACLAGDFAAALRAVGG